MVPHPLHRTTCPPRVHQHAELRIVGPLPCHQVGTILTHFMDTYQVTIPIRALWTDSIRTQFDHSRYWRI